MAQPTGQSGGKTHLGLRHSSPRGEQSHQWYRSFGSIGFNGEWWLNIVLTQKKLYSAASITTVQVTALPEEVDWKIRLEAEQTLIPILYLCLGKKREDEFHRMKANLDLTLTRYPRVFDAWETEFEKECNETYKFFFSCWQGNCILGNPWNSSNRSLVDCRHAKFSENWRPRYYEIYS